MDTVLIAEDDLKLRKFLGYRLQKRKSNLEVILASDGEEAIRILEETQISLLVSDIQMPKVDGLALLAYMNDNHPDIPCIVISAHVTPEIEKRLSDKTFRVLQKPFQLEELTEAIGELLDTEIPGGSLRGISVCSFLQMIQIEEKTCVLEIVTNEGENGLLYFEKGKLCDAMYRDLEGEAAALDIIALDRPRIRFMNPPKGKIPKRIDTELMNLIMESMRRKDESRDKEGVGNV